AKQWILAAPYDQCRCGDGGGEAAELRGIHFLQHRAPDAGRYRAGFPALMGDEIGIHRHGIGRPLTDKGGSLIDGIGQGMDILPQPGTWRAGPFYRQRRANEYQLAQAFAVTLRKYLSDHAAQRMAYEIHLVDLQMIEEEPQVIGHIGN